MGCRLTGRCAASLADFFAAAVFCATADALRPPLPPSVQNVAMPPDGHHPRHGTEKIIQRTGLRIFIHGDVPACDGGNPSTNRITLYCPYQRPCCNARLHPDFLRPACSHHPGAVTFCFQLDCAVLYRFPVPSFSTPEIFTAIFTPQKSRLNRRAVITLCYLANQNL